MEFLRKDRIKAKLEPDQQISLYFQRVKQNKEHRVLEGFCRLDLHSGGLSVVHLEVREHHGKKYSTEQKQKIRTTLDAVREAVEAAIEEQWERVNSFPSEED